MSLKIYYIDDEPDLLEIFTDICAEDGREIRTFSNPQEGIAALKSDPPDILFVDYQMPGMTGDQLAQFADASVPKYLITGNLSVDTATVFKAVLQKPIDFDEIRSILERHRLRVAA